MARRSFLPLVLVLFLAASVPGDEAKEDDKAIEGTWLPTAAELAGKNFPDDVLKIMKLTMTDGKYTVHLGEAVDKGTYKLDPAAKPRGIDVIGTEGANKGKTFPAIYELTADSLRICYDLEGKKRPTEFKTGKDTKQFFVTYKRDRR